MNRRTLGSFLSVVLACLVLTVSSVAQAADEAPDTMIKRVSNDVMDSIRADKSIQAGDINKVVAIVDTKIMPNVNFSRMTSLAVGRYWRQASSEQQKRLQEEFKILLIRTYSGALSQVKEHVVTVKPLRAGADDTEVLVRTDVKGRGEPIQLDYRLEKVPGGWKIYDLNVLGVWLIETYRGQFSQEISAKGIDGLIASLAQRNKSNAAAVADKKS